MVPLDQPEPRKHSKSARLATRRGCHATAIVPDLQLTRDAARRVCASLAPAHRILIPLRPLTGHSQLVSLSLPSRISVYPAFFRPCSRSYPAPLVLVSPSTFSFGDINPFLPAPSLSLSLTLLFPPPRSHGNFFLFYAALYRCSCLLTHSLLQFFRRSLRPSRAACRRLPFSFSLSRAANDRAPIHPSDFSLSYLSNSTYFPLPPPPPPCPLVAPFICLPSPTANRTHHLHHRISTTYLTSRASFRRLYLKH